LEKDDRKARARGGRASTPAAPRPFARLATAAGGPACVLSLVLLAALAVNGGRRGMPWVGYLPVPLMVLAAAGWLAGSLSRLPRRERMGNALLLASSLTLSVVAAETAARACLRRTQGGAWLERLGRLSANPQEIPQRGRPLSAIVRVSPNPRLGYELRPGMDKSFARRTLRTNAQGMRADRNFDPEPAPGRRRILGIGDSIMFGWGVHQNEDYLSVLERLLPALARGPSWETLNLAVPGYNTQQEVEMLEWRGVRFRPDVVVLGWCRNDFDPPLFAYRYNAFRDWNTFYLYAFLFDRPGFLKRIEPAFAAGGGPRMARQAMHPDIRQGVGPDGVRRSLGRLRKLADQHGCRVLVFGDLPDAVAALCREAGLEHCRFPPPDPGASPGAASGKAPPLHPDAEGHRRLAQVLGQALDERGWLAP